MAKEDKAAEGAAEAAPKKSKKLLIIIVAAVLVLVLGGGTAAFLLMKKGDDQHDDEEVAAEKDTKGKKKGEKEAPPVFVQLEPFTANLVRETGDQYLAVTLFLRVEDAAAGEKIKQFMPMIRHEILMIIKAKRPSELETPEGMQIFFDDIRDKINSVLEPTPAPRGRKQAAAEGPVTKVFATQFIVQ